MDQLKASMLEELSGMKQAIIRKGELEKELNETRKKEKDKFRQARIYAANYYTPAVIDEIYKKSTSVLKVKDFDPNVYKEKFSDIDTITLSDIEFLNDKEEEIRKALKTLSAKTSSHKKHKPLINFTDVVLGRKL